MEKNILIIGAPRCGKTTLARKIVKEYGYNIISLDDIICAFEQIPECGIRHDGKALEVAERFGGFLCGYLKELSEGPNFYGGVKYVIEGTHIDLKRVMPMLREEKYFFKYDVIGLLFDGTDPEKLYNDVKAHDTEDDWTYWCDDKLLLEKCECFIWKNGYFADKFKKHNIKTYTVTDDRKTVFDAICNDLFGSKEDK